MTDAAAVLQVALPSGPVTVQLVLDRRLDTITALLDDLDPGELEQTALNREDYDGDVTGGFVAAVLREIRDRLPSDA